MNTAGAGRLADSRPPEVGGADDGTRDARGATTVSFRGAAEA